MIEVYQVANLLAVLLALGVGDICNFLPKRLLELEAEVGIEQELVLSIAKPRSTQLSQSQAHRMTGSEITRKMAHL
ncbi:MAG: hypothetical protein ACYDC1_05750 [Limisphaerales bacterium]